MEKRSNSPDYMRFPDSKALNRVIVSESGFAFDPINGESFTLNPTALFLFQLMQQGCSQEEIVKNITNSYEISAIEAERDLMDFSALLCGSLN